MGIYHIQDTDPDSKVNVTNMGRIWGRQDPGGTHVGPMNLAISEKILPSMTVNEHFPRYDMGMVYVNYIYSLDVHVS